MQADFKLWTLPFSQLFRGAKLPLKLRPFGEIEMSVL